jgi:hypothetical protein
MNGQHRRKRASRKKTFRLSEMTSRFFTPEGRDDFVYNVGPARTAYSWLSETEEMRKRREHEMFLTIPNDTEMELFLDSLPHIGAIS